MMSLVFAGAALAANFQHPIPTPPADLPAAVYRERRDRVMKSLDGCIGILAAQGEVSGITEDYRQDADFFWLTGINEPGASMLELYPVLYGISGWQSSLKSPFFPLFLSSYIVRSIP